MTQPRLVLPAATYLLTRRVLLRHLLLHPDPVITNLILYALIVSAQRHGIQVHALCAMSNHLHLVVTDQRGVLPCFLQLFHKLVAEGTKLIRDWDGPVWDHEPTSVVLLTTREAVVQKIAYTLANPVAAGLVQHASEWPGAKVLVAELGGGELRATRPAVYFDAKNPNWPEEVRLELMLPPAIGAGQADDLRREVAAFLALEEATAYAKAQGDSVLSADDAASVSPYGRATSVEPKRARNPAFAVGGGRGSRSHDAWRRAAATVRAFRAEYHVALEQWRQGVRNVLFPQGTWWMRVFHAAGVGPEAAAG